MKVLALPRDPNPYQELLYGACAARGVRTRYVGELTPSHSLNLLLLPLELALLRLAGWRVLHVHWLFFFGTDWSGRVPALRRVSAVWFRLTLRVARLLGLRLVWTAHNVLPHEPVFDDDLRARRELVQAADLVIAHSLSAERRVADTLGTPRASTVIPLGPFGISVPRAAREAGAPLELLFFGTVLAYKGVEELLVALGRVGPEAPLRLTVAGRCPDEALRSRLIELASPLGERVTLRLERVPDEELPTLLGSHDVLVLPFRDVTTSSSAILGLEAGMPVLVPDLPVFEEMPVVTYEPGVDGLTGALRELAGSDRAELDRRGAESRAWATRLSWDDIADMTCRAFDGEVVSR
jgi:glycosyltransferase involved in cell wall biosynthesis